MIYEINNEFINVEKSIKKLSNHWQGPTADKALALISKMKTNEKSRYNILDNYSKTLKVSIGLEDEKTEKKVKDLADLFK